MHRKELQSKPRMQSESRHAFTMLGTVPSTVTRELSTNSPYARVPGAPRNRPIVQLFSSAEYTSQGPIIQPRLVGHTITSPRWRSWQDHASTPALQAAKAVNNISRLNRIFLGYFDPIFTHYMKPIKFQTIWQFLFL